jgi:hypothetical protein
MEQQQREGTGCGQGRGRVSEGLGWYLLQQGTGVQRVALGVIVQPGGRAGGQRGSELGAEAEQVRGVQPAERQPHGHVAPQQPAQAVRQAGLGCVPGKYQGEHPVDPQPAQRKGQRVQRRSIGPLRVVDHHQNRVRVLELTE